MEPENGAPVELERLPVPTSPRKSQTIVESKPNKEIDQSSDDFGESYQEKHKKKFNIKDFFRKNLNIFDQEISGKNTEKSLTQKDQPTATDRTAENKKEIFKKNMRQASKQSEDAKNFDTSDKSSKEMVILPADFLVVFGEKASLEPSEELGEKSEGSRVTDGKKSCIRSSKSFQENSGGSSHKSVPRRSISNGSYESQIEENLNKVYGGYQHKACRLSKFNPINHPENTPRDESPSILDRSHKEEPLHPQTRSPQESANDESYTINDNASSVFNLNRLNMPIKTSEQINQEINQKHLKKIEKFSCLNQLLNSINSSPINRTTYSPNP